LEKDSPKTFEQFRRERWQEVLDRLEKEFYIKEFGSVEKAMDLIKGAERIRQRHERERRLRRGN
jgi:hypothetical protein